MKNRKCPNPEDEEWKLERIGLENSHLKMTFLQVSFISNKQKQKYPPDEGIEWDNFKKK